jgi:hypothetical protein
MKALLSLWLACFAGVSAAVSASPLADDSILYQDRRVRLDVSHLRRALIDFYQGNDVQIDVVTWSWAALNPLNKYDLAEDLTFTLTTANNNRVRVTCFFGIRRETNILTLDDCESEPGLGLVGFRGFLTEFSGQPMIQEQATD